MTTLMLYALSYFLKPMSFCYLVKNAKYSTSICLYQDYCDMNLASIFSIKKVPSATVLQYSEHKMTLPILQANKVFYIQIMNNNHF